MQDEAKALVLCQQKVKQKNLPMEVVDAEFQWCVRPTLRCYFVAFSQVTDTLDSLLQGPTKAHVLLHCRTTNRLPRTREGAVPLYVSLSLPTLC